MESSLPHHLLECIMERLPVKSLLRFKVVSNQWKSTIESGVFQERHLKHRQQSGDPEVLMVSVFRYEDAPSEEEDMEPVAGVESLRTLVVGSPSPVDIYTPWEDEYYLVSRTSCDGLVCLYYPETSGYVGNPTTRWYRPLPPSNFQQIVLALGGEAYLERYPLFKLGFGKDKVNGTYKPVWLYNSAEFGLENVTTCEVFDFTTNAWRYVTPSCPYRISSPDPAYVDGSLHWFTDCQETQVVSFDLHTEAFQVLSKAPFANARPRDIVMCNLDNRLCVSEMKWPNQVIWSFHSGNKAWEKMYSIDLPQTSILSGSPTQCALLPLGLLDGKTKKLLFYFGDSDRTLVIHEPHTKSYDAAFTAVSLGNPICYFPSLISI